MSAAKKTIEFDDLDRHLKAILPIVISVHGLSGGFLFTTRSEPLGMVGDVFFVEGIGNVALIDCTKRIYAELTVLNVYEREGFEKMEDYLVALRHRCNNGEQFETGMHELYVHTLLILNTESLQEKGKASMDSRPVF